MRQMKEDEAAHFAASYYLYYYSKRLREEAQAKLSQLLVAARTCAAASGITLHAKIRRVAFRSTLSVTPSGPTSVRMIRNHA